MTAVVWIRRSLREYDNTALVEASKEHEELIPFYVVDDDYFSNAELGYPRVKFWHDSLVELKEGMKEEGKDLIVRKGRPIEQLKNIVEETDPDEVYYNRDYSPYSKKRDSRAEEELEVPVNSFKDIVMFEKEEILTNSGTPYKVYSYYAKKWFDKKKRRPGKPEDYTVPELGSDEIPSVNDLGYEKPEEMNWYWNPGREGGKKRLEEFKDKIWNYDENRDYAWKDSTSKLSPHLKFGTVSIREVFWEAERIKARKPDMDAEGIKTWQEELAWRDFYFQVMWNFPYCVEKPFLEQYEDLEWRSKEEASEEWERFIEGRTGYPFVDAGMRQLKEEGWMHNRLRMVVTSFACKDLWLDWKDIHSYFKRMFVDAELSAMIGGIQWAYSIGTDAQPYFRVFNPRSQSESYDPDGEYIREYVPELEDVPDKYIHNPQKMPKTAQHDADCIVGEDYPEPIVDHDDCRKEAVSRFEKVREDEDD
ncbi:MAG: deoxyribodipyrimidine photo-lyase [Nanohaloarchaea archaeon]|nr:deoxyribodipyrimidine photo-lyase [Candidatus Nanohaloarchaea archaeon]